MLQSVPLPPATQATDRKDHRTSDPVAQRIWDYVSHSELGSLWNFEGTPVMVVLKRTAKAFMDDDLLSRAAELGFYFLFALFPMLICASSVLGLAARSASTFYDSLLHSLARLWCRHRPTNLSLRPSTRPHRRRPAARLCLGSGGTLVCVHGLRRHSGHTQPRLQSA